MGVKSYLLRLLPFAGMVMVECLDVGLTTLSKAAMSKGMSHFVFVVYSNALATIILFPSSFIFHGIKRPPIGFSLLCKFFLLAFVGITVMQNCVFTGVNYSSPTLGSAISQLVPAFTFLLAVIFRMEKFDLTSSRTQVKILGTVVSIAGALIVILYKGPAIGALKSHPQPTNSIFLAKTSSWVIGGLFLSVASLSLSIFNIFQAAILRDYPSEMTILSFYALFGTLQSLVVTLIAEHNPAAWKLTLDIELITVVYSALCGTVVSYGVMTWCIHKKGPVFVAMFKPLSIAIATLLGVIFLGDTLHVGSIVGAIIIVTGFYGVIWAQNKEEAQGLTIEENKQKPASPRTPLLDTERHMDA